TVRSGVDQALRPGPTVEEPARPRTSATPWLVVAALLMVIAAGAWYLFGRGAQRAPIAPAPAPPPAPIARARLGINAFPWGEVTSIRNVGNGESALPAPLVTPAPVDLAPGTYEITLTNPKYPQPLRRTVSLRPGDEQSINLSFVDPASVSLPRFDGAAQ
ncbi:MAG TPA: PEGA domain-containing protein, partial [Thermoanaerobaculia bacterium]|nr:PEGA domain-containing protein [Thermoanaerobaculia bacterium]